jgi:DNA repair protein RadD
VGRRKNTKSKPKEIQSKVIPRYYQQEAHDAVWQYLSNQSGNPVVVLPTGAGKSLLAAMLVEQARAFDARVIVLQHRKELIEQNAEKIQILLPDIKIGIYSAGLNSRDTEADVVCAGIQSVHSKAHEFGRRELILIDEVHLVSGNEDSMYGKFLADIQQINPRARFVGMSATPFRTGEGPICGKNKLFQRICYEAFTGDLIREGWLCPVTNKPADATVDTSKIKQRGSEFISSEMAKAFDSGDKVAMACGEIVAKCHDRHSVLVFAAGVEHAEHVADTLRTLTGERVGIVTGDTMPIERVASLSAFKAQELRWLVNCDVLTTGFDAPCIDAIAILRATMSPGLFAQIVGRGLRKHESKTECKVLDFGGNIARHGSIDDPNYGRATPGSGSGGSGVEKNGRGKECLNCGIDVPAGDKECPECGFRFPDEPKDRHDETSDSTSTLTGMPDPEQWEVVGCTWGIHTKKANGSRTLRVDYNVQPMDSDGGNLTQKVVSEWVCFEHTGFARTKAGLWWRVRSEHPEPNTIDDAVAYLDRHVARVPATLTTQDEGKYTRIVSVEFIDERPDECEWLEVACVEPGDGDGEYYFDDDEVPF